MRMIKKLIAGALLVGVSGWAIMGWVNRETFGYGAEGLVSKKNGARFHERH